MRQYRFRALVTFDSAAGSHLGGPHACCLIQPCHGTYFPATISSDTELTVRSAVRAVVSLALADGEAKAFFVPGQRFMIWADAVIGQTIQAGPLVGHGVISGQMPLPPSPARAVTAASRAHDHRLTGLGMPTTHDRPMAG